MSPKTRRRPAANSHARSERARILPGRQRLRQSIAVFWIRVSDQTLMVMPLRKVLVAATRFEGIAIGV